MDKIKTRFRKVIQIKAKFESISSIVNHFTIFFNKLRNGKYYTVCRIIKVQLGSYGNTYR